MQGPLQVGAARDLQFLPGKSALQKYHARRLLQTPPNLDITGGSNPLNSNALNGGLNTGLHCADLCSVEVDLLIFGFLFAGI